MSYCVKCPRHRSSHCLLGATIDKPSPTPSDRPPVRPSTVQATASVRACPSLPSPTLYSAPVMRIPLLPIALARPMPAPTRFSDIRYSLSVRAANRSMRMMYGSARWMRMKMLTTAIWTPR